MNLARVVGKGRVESMDRAEFSELARAATRTLVDLGTGDAHLAYKLASEHADWFVVGVDALNEPMGEIAHKAARKPARGGRSNLVLLRASVESLPGALTAIADEVRVVLPWGALLEGIVRARAEVVAGIAQPLKPGACLDVILNGEIWVDSTPVRFEHLPLPTPEYVAATIAPSFARAGINLGAASWMTATEIDALHSSWARRLRHGRAHPRFLRFTGVRAVAPSVP